jgi:multicomponent Na+:H+ antiporter subunit D
VTSLYQSVTPALIVIVPLLVSFALPLIGWWKRDAVFPVAIAALIFVLGTSIVTTQNVLIYGSVHYFMGGWAPPWGIEYRVDHLGALMLMMVSIVTLLVGIYSKRSVLQELPDKEIPFYSVYLLLISGLMGMVATADMFNLYVFLEISSLASYALISIGGGSAIVSAFRYVILGTVGAAFYLLSVGYLYSVTGSLNMADLATILPSAYESNAVLVGFAFFVIGMSIKMALFPMHAWLPGAYSDAPSAVSALIAATTTKVAAYVLIRVMFFVFEPRFSIEMIPVTALLSWMGAIAMLLGSVMAVAQSDIKRMLAYSSVAQIGYIVLGIGLANTMGLTGGLLHLVGHAFMKACLFLVAGSIVYRTGLRQIREFRHLSVKMPWTSAIFVVAAFSMIGIPPTTGFFSKLYLTLGAIDDERWIFVAVILISSILALMYFMNVIRYMYLPEEKVTTEGSTQKLTSSQPIFDEAPLTMLIPMGILAVLIIVLGLFNGEIVSSFIDPAISTRIR